MSDGGDVLATIVAATTRGVDVRATPEARRALDRAAEAWRPRGAALLASLAAPGAVRIIAECKRRSPSRGILRGDYDPAAIARQYAAAGATAISVLTEPTFFDGALDHLRAVRAAVPTPILRKDFFVDEFQILEAHAAGADAILLIVAALDDATLIRLHAAADARGLAALVEVHTAEELARAQQAGARLIGVNSRNLKTLAVSLETALTLGPTLGPGVVGVAESGIRSRADIDALTAAGYRAFLVGERFMSQPDPGAALRELVGVAALGESTASHRDGRGARRSRREE
jgi:indole-3-glycerol phosphate synthase